MKKALVLGVLAGTALFAFFCPAGAVRVPTGGAATSVSANGTVVTNAGKLGVLNANPTYELDVTGSGRITTALGVGGVPNGLFSVVGTSGDGEFLRVRSGSYEYVTIGNGCHATGTAMMTLCNDATATSQPPVIQLNTSAGTEERTLKFSDGARSLTMGIVHNSTDPNLRIKEYNSNLVLVNISSTGRVGIGLDTAVSPEKLFLAGTGTTYTLKVATDSANAPVALGVTNDGKVATATIEVAAGSQFAPAQASVIRGTITPDREGAQVYNTVDHYVCVATGTTVSTWAQLHAPTTACGH